MEKFSRYLEIESLHRVPEILMVRETVILEKIHGINIRFGYVGEQFRVGGKNEEFDLEKSAPSAGFGFVGWLRESSIPKLVADLAKDLKQDIIFYGEWHGKGIQKVVQYLDKKDLRIFDVLVEDEFKSWDYVVDLSNTIGVKTVPLLYRGAPSMEIFENLRHFPSRVAYEHGFGAEDNIAEGIVIKPTPMARNLRGDWIISKHKDPKFEERASLRKEPKAHSINPEEAYTFVEEFFTSERLNHVLTYVRESGVDVASPKAIGLAIKGMYDDVIKESKEEFSNLPEEIQKAINKLHSSRTKHLLERYLLGG